jgi:SAM-dependent methyltransferase
MADQTRPYAIHSDSECDRLERQAALAGLEHHLRHVPVPEAAYILDAGCGSGAMTRCFGSRYADASVIGVDIRDDYVSYAQGRANEDGLKNVEFRQGSVFNLPFANASFDVVWSKYVMQWIDEPERAVAEFRRVTKPGGVVVCCNFDGFAVTHYPEDEALQRQILTVFPRLVDVYIGRKTASIFHTCGLINISVVFEPDSLFTTVGSIDPERRENWVVQLAAARPYIAKILGSDERAREFGDSFIRYYDRPDTSSYTALYFVRGRVARD